MHLKVTLRGGKTRNLSLPITFWKTTINAPAQINLSPSAVIPRIMTNDIRGISDSPLFCIPIEAIDMLELEEDAKDVRANVEAALENKPKPPRKQWGKSASKPLSAPTEKGA